MSWTERLEESLTAPAHAPLKTDGKPNSNWVEKAGGLPGPIDAVARALVAKRGWDIGRAIATAVNAAKEGCATGKAFGGKATLKPETRAIYCKAVASWEAKKKAGRVKEETSAIAFSGADLNMLYEVAEAELLKIQEEMGGRDALREALFNEAHRRRDARGRWVRDSLFGNQITYERPVRIDSDLFGKDQYGHVQSVDSETGSVYVRIEDPGPEFAEDLEGVSYDQAEFVDVVSHRSIRDAETGETLPSPKPEVTALKADLLRQAAVRQNAERRARTQLPTGRSEDQVALDRGLRSRVAEAETWLAVLDGAQGALRVIEAWEPLMENWSDEARRAAAEARRRGAGRSLSGHDFMLRQLKASGHSGGGDGPRATDGSSTRGEFVRSGAERQAEARANGAKFISDYQTPEDRKKYAAIDRELRQLESAYARRDYSSLPGKGAPYEREAAMRRKIAGAKRRLATISKRAEAAMAADGGS